VYEGLKTDSGLIPLLEEWFDGETDYRKPMMLMVSDLYENATTYERQAKELEAVEKSLEQTETELSNYKQMVLDLTSEKDSIIKEYSQRFGQMFEELQAANARIAELTTPSISITEHSS